MNNKYLKYPINNITITILVIGFILILIFNSLYLLIKNTKINIILISLFRVLKYQL